MESSKTPSAWHRSAPAIMLIVLAPVIAELLYGGTRFSYLYALIPEAGIWGCGALMIRYVARLRNLPWTSVLLLGLALAIAEEFIIQQTSIAPLTGLAKYAYGRVWGVNWVYFLWALGYESVWVVMIPIQLAELMYPNLRKALWLSSWGLFRAAVSFAVTGHIAWYSWTQVARTKVFHMPPYQPPYQMILAAITAIALLALVGLRLPAASEPKPPKKSGPPPAPWLVGLAAFVFGAPWSAFVVVGYGDLRMVPFEIPLAIGIVWACAAFILIKRWSANPGWGDRHRMALVFGGIMACMIGGFFVFRVGGALPIDWAGKIATNIIALFLLIKMNRQIQDRDPVRGSSPNEAGAGEPGGRPAALPKGPANA
jgi:hypothetical protein